MAGVGRENGAVGLRRAAVERADGGGELVVGSDERERLGSGRSSRP